MPSEMDLFSGGDFLFGYSNGLLVVEGDLVMKDGGMVLLTYGSQLHVGGCAEFSG